jgi:ribonuclease III
VDPRGYERLEAKLGYTFKDKQLLETSLVHKSYLNEHRSSGMSDNERLEFLGDAVLDLAVGHLLMDHLPKLREGELSMTRAQIVNEQALAVVAADLGIGEWLFLGRGEEHTGGRRKPSLLANACEAIIAAVYLDGGYGESFEVVKRLFLPRILGLDAPPGFADFKTRLQEAAQAILGDTPRYVVTGEGGPDHDKFFEVAVTIGGKVYARSAGRSKREAEHAAAATALFFLEAERPPP